MNIMTVTTYFGQVPLTGNHFNVTLLKRNGCFLMYLKCTLVLQELAYSYKYYKYLNPCLVGSIV